MPSLPAKPFYQDGDYTTPQLLWTSGREYPFSNDGDLATYTYRRRYLVRAASYAPAVIGSVDPLEAGSYLLAETPPDRNLSPLAEIERTYGRIPASRLTYGAITYSLPQIQAPSGTATTFPRGFDFLDGRAYQPAEVSNTTHLYTRRPVASDTGAPADASGGTFTITFNGQTTAPIAYNASAATVQTAINGLSSVITPWGSFIVLSYLAGGKGYQFTLTPQSPNPAINVSSITVPSGVLRGSSVADGAQGTVCVFYITVAYNTANPAPAISVNTAGLTATGFGTLTSSTGVDADVSRVNIGVTSYPTTISGTYTLTVGANTTAPLAYNSTGTEIAAALNALPSVQAVGKVSEVNGGLPIYPVYSNTPAIAIFARFVPKVTGGTFTLTLFGATTGALAYNATAATIKTAVDGIAGVSARGGATVTTTVYDGGIRVTVSYPPPLMSLDAASLTPSGYVYTVVEKRVLTGSGGGPEVQVAIRTPVAVRRTLSVPGHGYRAGDFVYFKEVAGYTYGLTAGISALDTDTLSLDPAVAPWATAGTISEIGMRVALYTPRAVRVRNRTTRDFYLPGVSAGIVNLGDLPLGFPPLSDEIFFAQLFARTDWAPYETSDPARWQGDIYELAQTEIQISNLG
jgi:hypothetical protein